MVIKMFTLRYDYVGGIREHIGLPVSSFFYAKNKKKMEISVPCRASGNGQHDY